MNPSHCVATDSCQEVSRSTLVPAETGLRDWRLRQMRAEAVLQHWSGEVCNWFLSRRNAANHMTKSVRRLVFFITENWKLSSNHVRSVMITELEQFAGGIEAVALQGNQRTDLMAASNLSKRSRQKTQE